MGAEIREEYESLLLIQMNWGFGSSACVCYSVGVGPVVTLAPDPYPGILLCPVELKTQA